MMAPFAIILAIRMIILILWSMLANQPVVVPILQHVSVAQRCDLHRAFSPVGYFVMGIPDFKNSQLVFDFSKKHVLPNSFRID